MLSQREVTVCDYVTGGEKRGRRFKAPSEGRGKKASQGEKRGGPTEKKGRLRDSMLFRS